MGAEFVGDVEGGAFVPDDEFVFALGEVPLVEAVVFFGFAFVEEVFEEDGAVGFDDLEHVGDGSEGFEGVVEGVAGIGEIEMIFGEARGEAFSAAAELGGNGGIDVVGRGGGGRSRWRGGRWG